MLPWPGQQSSVGVGPVPDGWHTRSKMKAGTLQVLEMVPNVDKIRGSGQVVSGREV